MLSILMADNNQLRFFDIDFGEPTFKRRKPIPLPKLIKIEQIDLEDRQSESGDSFNFVMCQLMTEGSFPNNRTQNL